MSNEKYLIWNKQGLQLIQVRLARQVRQAKCQIETYDPIGSLDRRERLRRRPHLHHRVRRLQERVQLRGVSPTKSR